MDYNNSSSSSSATTDVAQLDPTGFPAPVVWRVGIFGIAALDVTITLFVALRCYVRFSSRLRLHTEDFLDDRLHMSDSYMYVSEILLQDSHLTTTSSSHLETVSQLGVLHPIVQVLPALVVGLKKSAYAAGATYSPAAITTKTTLLLMTARAFASKPRVSRGIHLFIALLVLLSLPIQICKLVICTPVQAFWDDTIRDKTCLNQGILFLCDTMIAVLSDLVILVLPICLTWSLAAPVEKKLKISALLGAGGIAVGLTVYRLYWLWLYANKTDSTKDYVPLGLLATSELSIGIVCACLPSLNILLERRLAKKYLASGGSPHHHMPRRGLDPLNELGNSESKRSGSSARFASWLSSRLSTNNTSNTTGMWESSQVQVAATTASFGGGVGGGGGPLPPLPPPSRADPYAHGHSHMATTTTTILQVDVDVELGIITETAGEDMDITSGQGQSGRSRVLSIDGRREGWLAPSPTMACQDEGAGKEGGKSGHNQRAPTSEVIYVGETTATGGEPTLPQWDFIWDGTRTAFTDTRLQELRNHRSP